jgi:hypothetical protein
MIIDKHTLCIQARDYSMEEIIIFVKDWMKYDPTCDYILAFGTDHDNIFQGFAYLHVSKTSMFHVLLGKKPDGSENIAYIPDPTFVPTSTIDWTQNPFLVPLIIDWEKEATLALAPTLPHPLPPLISLPDMVQILPAHIADNTQFTNSLIIKNVPDWITDDQIKKLVHPFSNHETYPRLEKLHSSIKIVFNPGSFDAHFASFLLKKTRVNHPSLKDVHVILQFRLFWSSKHNLKQ